MSAVYCGICNERVYMTWVVCCDIIMHPTCRKKHVHEKEATLTSGQ